MDRWQGKVAVVTGASAGIGACIVKKLAEAGMRVVGLARRIDKMQQIAAQLPEGRLIPISCDVCNEEDIVKAFQFVEKELGGLQVLVNNAGVILNEPLLTGNPENIRKILNVNVVGVAVCTREAVKIMKKNKVNGHIVNMNSMAGHFADSIQLPLSVYPASKYALTAMTIGTRHEIAAEKLPIKMTCISPGAVKTDMMGSIGIPEEVLNNMPILHDKDIADAVLYAIGTPPNVQVLELLISPLESITS
ncbi:farnesol dehydrogenase-like [Prorops nasuta]|uniref:farnesol dehydrogenase-like n=1 Tax=Prorops nasuta TaxID=863751 RepID=UPI0034CFE235